MNEKINENPLEGKIIKKITWHYSDTLGIVVNISTDDGYDLRYSALANGDLLYIDTKDSG
jgi:hypothetical protein